MTQVATIAIGRNEGERLHRCLASLLREGRPVVYVDSGSTDGSVAYARQVGAEVVELDMSMPFTAARARNAGFRRLMAMDDPPKFVQLVDGDCTLLETWFEKAVEALQRDTQCAVVCGRLHELYPEHTIYNRLADMEWNTPVGEAQQCGGVCMIRAHVLRDVGMFDESLIAGEEPELSARIRRAGWTIQRLPEDMGHHDAAITAFSQWWKRGVRGGHAFLEGYLRHRNTPQEYWGRNVRSSWFWGLMFPLVVVGLMPLTGGWSALLLLAYPLMVLRIARNRMRTMHDPPRHALLYGVAMMVGKFPAMIGQLQYLFNRLRGRSSQIIEYKTAG